MNFLLICHALFSIEAPWDIPRGCAPVELRRSTGGGMPRLRTTVTTYADREYLNVLFHAADDEVIARYRNHDDPLYEEDVVEVFLSPATPTTYFEIEVNPLGTTFDARVESPDGVRSTMRVDRGWTCTNLFAAIRRTPGFVDTIVRIPFSSLGVHIPAPGDVWRGNFFRIDRSHSHGDEFSAWRPTLKNPADFHVVAAFGRLRFE